MSSLPSKQDLPLKRKKPPTFQHLPAQRAKKLKRSWVEVQKIKSKWNAQKRKEGLVASRHQLEHRAGVDENNSCESAEDPEDEEKERVSGPSDGSLGGAASKKSGDEAVDSESEESSEDEGPGTSSARATSAPSRRANPPKSARNGPQKSLGGQPSLRDLQRVAYSPASLHTHKWDPLHRHRGTTFSRGRCERVGDKAQGRGGGRNGETRGGGVQRGRGRGRGRGQPDMGLRMKAMLERIKQDFT